MRIKKYHSVDDLRDEFQDDFKALETITKGEKVLEDYVIQFVKKRYEKLPFKSPVETLEEYCIKNPLKEEIPLT